MRVSRLNAVLLLALFLAGGLHLALRANPAQRNWEVLPGMMTSPAAETFTPNANFADGKTLQGPPPGTVVRGLLPLPYTASPEDAARAGRELASPWRADEAAALARGARVWADICQMCHGAQGKGDGPVAQRGFPAPPSLLAEKARGLPDGQIFHILTWGQGNMPPHAAQLSREDRWKAVLFVRKLQREAPAAPAVSPIPPATAAAPPGAATR